MNTAMQWLLTNWSTILEVLLALTSVIGTVRNLLTHFDSSPRAKKFEGFFSKALDVLSWITAHGHDGPLAMLPGPLGQLLGKLSLPGFVSKARDDKSPNGALNLLPLFFLVLLSGCTSWKTPSYLTLNTIVRAADEAQSMLPSKCKAAMDAAVASAKNADEATKAGKLVLDRCDAALEGAEATGKIARTARDGIYDISAALKDPKAVMSWAIAAIDGYQNLASLFRTLNIDLPKIPGVN